MNQPNRNQHKPAVLAWRSIAGLRETVDAFEYCYLRLNPDNTQLSRTGDHLVVSRGAEELFVCRSCRGIVAVAGNPVALEMIMSAATLFPEMIKMVQAESCPQKTLDKAVDKHRNELRIERISNG